MERTGVMELRRPMRTLKVEGAGRLRDRRQWGKSETGIFPVNFQSGALRIRSDARVAPPQ